MTGMPNPSPSPFPPALREQAQTWLLCLQSGRATEADAEAFRRWRAADPQHARAFAQARQLWQALGPALTSAPAAAAPAPLATPLPARRGATTARPRARVDLRRRAFLGGAVAAAAVGWVGLRSPLGLWPEWQALAADYHTATGERRQLQIQGVAVEMAARTALRLPADGSAGIELREGEAQFDLAAGGAPGFAIHAAGAVVTAGDPARVNVRCIDGDTRVTCLAGQVQVRRGDRTVLLQPGIQARLDADRITSVAPVAAERVDAWRQGWLVFDDQPLGEVVDEINRYRTGRIVITGQALAQRRVQARIPITRIDSFVELVRDAYGARVVSMPGGVVLLG